jgi:hypothetical protein
MPYDGLNNYTLPTSTAAVLGATIQSTKFNLLTQDIENALNDLRYQNLNSTSLIALATAFSAASASGAAYLDFAEDTDNGSNYARVTAPASIASNATITLPGATGTLATLAGAETLSNKSFSTAPLPSTDDGAALGSASFKWSDAWFASGAVINWNNGNVTLNQTPDRLDLIGANIFQMNAYTTHPNFHQFANYNHGAGVVGTYSFYGQDSAAGTELWARVLGYANDVTPGSEDSSIYMDIMKAGTLVTSIVQDGSSVWSPIANRQLGIAGSRWGITYTDTIELGNDSDTTLARSSAGNVSIEGNIIYRAGGTDVPLADGGTGASLTDPNADRIMFWDDSAGAVTWLTAGTGLSISGTDLTASVTGTLDSISVFTSGGTWNRPSGVTRVLMFVTGAGGGGAANSTAGEHGGGAGGTAIKFLNVTSIASSTITVSATGGAGGAAGNNSGVTGSNSSWADGTNTITGNGGAGGQRSGAADQPGNGGSATGGDINLTGGGGGLSIDGTGGFGGTSFWGGSTRAVASGAGLAGATYGNGGGGNGANTGAGGAGAGGVVLVLNFK